MYQFWIVIETILASLYPLIAQKVQELFSVVANPWILLIFRSSFPLLEGIICGMGMNCKKEKQQKRILFEIMSVVVNVLMVCFWFQKKYVISTYNLLICGIFLVGLLKEGYNGTQKLLNK